ncbi:perlucin-like protein isoform X2 [Ptychodera flava]|uniref:perlucin-like protein isoform X2 n=1 Tax=Ptychodera flava TaxID=63121 RepID=UPI00396A0791
MKILAVFVVMATVTSAIHLEGCVPSFCMCTRYEVFCDSAHGETAAAAQAFCEERGGTLANMKTKEIDDAVRTFIKNEKLDNQGCAENYGFWIGLNDRKVEGQHEWSDGTPLCPSYTNWAPDQPNNNDKKDPDGQDCGQLWFRGNNDLRWDDEYCDYRPKGIVCEIPNHCCCGAP